MKNQYTTKATTINYSRTLVFLAFLLLISVCNSYSQVRVPFAPRTANATPTTSVYTVKGDFTMIGNTNLTLEPYLENANNDEDMVYVDIDGDSNTWNSSSATLTFSNENGAFPECSNVIYAGLYWTGRAGSAETFTVTNGTETKEFDKRKVQLKKGTTGVYKEVVASNTAVVNKNIYFPSGTDGDMYSAYAEITDYVKANGIGEYFVADIATREGDGGNIGYYGGWGMVVVYENSQMNWRDITVFDGHAFVQREGAVGTSTNYNFDVDGFKTAENGYINVKLGIMAGEGDVGVSGDTFGILNRTSNEYEPLSHNPSTDPIDPSTNGNTSNNFFNSSINTGGNLRNPSLINNTGVDIAMFELDNGSNDVNDPDYNRYITNEQSSTSFQYGTNQDTYVIFNVTFSVDAYVPETEIIVENTSSNGTLIPGGDPGVFTIEIKNTGTEATTNTTLSLPIPLSVDPINFTAIATVNNPYTLDTDITIEPATPGNNGTIVWNMGTLPIPNNPDDVIAQIVLTYNVTTDCSTLTDPDFDEFVTLLGTISGTGQTSGKDFDFDLIQGYKIDGNCIGDPITEPLKIPINVDEYVNEAPTITAPSTLVVSGCDEKDVTVLTARYPYSTTESNDIKDSYDPDDVTDDGYTAEDNGTIVSITYIDEIVTNTSCPLEITRTYTATDDCGKTATAIQTISVDDTTDPSISAPTDVTIECSESSDPSNTGTATGSDICGTVTINYTDSSTQTNNDSCTDYTYVITRTWTATDVCGNSTSANQTITVEDTTGPEITCPASITQSADSDETYATVDILLPNVTDNCGGPVTYTHDYRGNGQTNFEDASGKYDVGTTTVTYTATDKCGNESQCSFTVTVNDIEAPELVCPPLVTVSCIALVPTYDDEVLPSDNYANFVAAGGSAYDPNGINENSFRLVSQSSDGKTCPETISIVYSIRDYALNESFCTHTIIVNDETAPSLTGTAYTDTTNYNSCRADAQTTVPAWTEANAIAGYTDNCGATVTATLTNTETTGDDCDWSVTYTYTVFDECLNPLASQFYSHTGSDQTAPTGTAPTGVSNVNLCAADAESTYPFVAATVAANYSDNCLGTVTVQNLSTDFTDNDDCGWTLIYTYDVVDDCGNLLEGETITHTGSDQTAPTGTAPTGVSNVNLCAADAESTYPFVAATVAANYSDNCLGTITVQNLSTDFTDNDDCGWTLIYTYDVVDDCGNLLEGETITHTGSDQTAPTGTAPTGVSNVNLCAADAESTYPFVAATVAANYSDNCLGTVTVQNLSTDFTDNDDCGWTLIYTYDVVDDCGNLLEGETITHTGSDQTAPTGTAPTGVSNVNLCAADAESTYPFVAATVAANYSDNCLGTITVQNLSTDFTDNDDCGWTLIYTYDVVDDCGNLLEGETITHTGSDQTAPTGTAPTGVSNVNLCAADAESTYPFVAATVAANYSDNCLGTVTIQNLSTDFIDNDDCGWTLIYTYDVVDDCGNLLEGETITHTGSDQTAPTGTAPTGVSNVNLCAADAESTYPFVAATVAANYSDNCLGTVTVQNLSTDFTDNDDCGWTLIYTYDVVDDCGNLLEGETITHAGSDQTAPTGTAPTGVSNVNLCAADAESTYPFVAATVAANYSDNCLGTITVQNLSTDFTDNDDCGWTLIYTYDVVDDCGNLLEGETITHTGSDQTAPTGTAPTGVSNVNLCAADAESTYPFVAATVAANYSDNCLGTVTVQNLSTDFTDNDDCGWTLIYTYDVVDDCGNLLEGETITHAGSDQTAPSLTGTAYTDNTDYNSCRDNAQTTVPAWTEVNAIAGYTDNCEATVTATLTNTETTGDDCDWTVTYTYTVFDECLNPLASQSYSHSGSDQDAATGTTPDGTDNINACANESEIDGIVTTASDEADIEAAYTDDCGTVTATFVSQTLTGDNCTWSLVRTYNISDGCSDNDFTVTMTHTGSDKDAAIGTTPDGTDNINACANESEIDGIVTTASDEAAIEAAYTDDCGAVTATFVSQTLTGVNCSWSLERTFNISDGCSANEFSVSMTHSGSDKTVPVIDNTNLENIEIECGAGNNEGKLANWLTNNAGATATDNCSSITWTNDYGQDDSVRCDDNAIRVTFTATDQCGNKSTTSATYLIKDTVAPNITVSAFSETVECDGSGNEDQLNDWLAANGGANAFDNCSIITWTNDFTSLSDECGETGSATVTFTATDACGNASSTTAIFTIEDKTAPVMDTEASNETVECDGAGNTAALQAWLDANGGASASDLCGGTIEWSNDYTALSDECGETGSTTVIFTATDLCSGESTSTTAIFTIEDKTAPVMDTEASNETVECDGAGNTAALQAWLDANGGASASDLCGGTIEWSNDYTALSDECGETGSTTVIFTATDLCSGESTSTTAIFTIEDKTAPVMDTEASNETVECDGAGNTAALQAWLDANGGASASDLCGGTIEWSNDYTALSDECGATGSTTVIFTATDLCSGESTSTTAIFTIEDKTAPVMDTEASNETVECDGAGNTAALQAWLDANGGASASDLCGGTIEWSNDYTALSDECGATGSTTIIFTATDLCSGESTSTTAIFTIEDKTAPVMDKEASNETVECDGAGNTAALNAWLAANGGAAASDACGGTIEWSNDYTALSDDCGATGSTTVIFTATDLCSGESTSTTATFTIENTTAPVIDTEASNETVECDGAGNTAALQAWLDANGGASASDLCGGTIEWSNDYTVLSDECGATGSTTVIFTATDLCSGESTSTTAIFTIEDKTAPVMDTEASDETVECNGAGNTAALQAWLDANGGASASDLCGGTIEWSNDYTALSDECGETGSTTVIFMATDLCSGEATSTTATFTIEDKTAPVMDTEASDETVECDGAGNTAALQAWLDANGGASASDACGGTIEWSNDYTALSDECGETGSTTVIFTATDLCSGESTSTTATFTIENTTAPVMDTEASDETVECDGAGNTAALQAWLDANGGASASDACGGTIEWSNDYTALSDECGETGSTTVIFTATDLCSGEATSTTATFTIEDTTAPVMDTEASNETVECDGAGNTAALQAWLDANGGASASDLCGGTIEWSNDYTALSDECGATGSTTVIFTATDLCSGESTSTTAIFTIEDKTAPVMDTEASNETVECDGAGNTAALQAWLDANGGASASDACGGTIEWSNDYTALSDECGETGSTTVIFTATDLCSGESTSTTATFTIENTTAPVMDTEASDETVECDGAGNTAALQAWLDANGGASASDACGGTIEWSNDYTALSDECGETGSTTVIFTATDLCSGESTSTTATFTIEDTTNPDIDNTDINDLEMECGTGDIDAAIIEWLTSNAGATAIDSCSTITWTNNYGSDNSVQCENEPITVTFTATDACGNQSITTATYLIKDTEAPIINNVTGDLDANLECSDISGIADALALEPTATDECSTAVINLVSDVTTVDTNCVNAYERVRVWNFTDGCGNVSPDFKQTITVIDSTSPIINNIAGDLDANLECSDAFGINNALALEPTATDNCTTPTLNLVSDDTTVDPNCNNAYVRVRVWNFTDGCGNSSPDFTQTITVVDTTAPELTLPPNVSAECSDDLTPLSFGSATATDNCDSDPVITFTDVRTDGACSGTYTITRTWSATDSCGNVTTADQIISTSDLTAPEFDQAVLPGNIVVECDAVPGVETLTATDNCGEAEVTVNDIRTDGNCDYNYTITRTYTATDECGLTKTHVQTITVQDTTPPVFVESLPAANIVVECDSVPSAETLTATDSCGTASVSVSDTRTDGTCPNSYTLTRTWTAKDECGLTTTYSQNIIVQDTTAPEFVETLPRDITVECDDIPGVDTITATDNCGDATVTAIDVITNGDCPLNYFIARTWTATDECGLTTSHTQIITVQDTTAPELTTTYDETLEVSCTDIPDAPELEFTDNCSSASNLIIVFNETSSFEENVYEDYQIIRTWTVRDECKNEAVYIQTINVILDEIYSEIVAEDRCYDDGILNLNDIISDSLNTNGTWELLEGNPDATLNGSIFDPTVLNLSYDFLPGDGGTDYRFRYTTTHEGCISITEVIMNIHADCVVLPCGENDIKISTALTPNGDGYNDSFDIMGIDLCGFVAEVKIFNRWGALVYESNNYTLGSIETSGANGDWNGSAPNSSVGNKSKLPNGTYYYIIKLQNSGLSPITGPLYLGTK